MTRSKNVVYHCSVEEGGQMGTVKQLQVRKPTTAEFVSMRRGGGNLGATNDRSLCRGIKKRMASYQYPSELMSRGGMN